MNLRIGRISKLLAPGYSWCLRCHTTWRFVKHHSTDYGRGSGCFPLCEKCWRDLGTPGDRLPYYWELWLDWQRFGSIEESKWERIRAAVLAGG